MQYIFFADICFTRFTGLVKVNSKKNDTYYACIVYISAVILHKKNVLSDLS